MRVEKAYSVQHHPTFTGLVAVGLAVVGVKGELALHGRWALLPELFDRLVINPVLRLVPDNAGQFAIAKSVVKRFQSSQLLHHVFGDRLAPTGGDDFGLFRKEPQHPLVPKATGQIAHGFGVKLGLLCPLGRGAIAKEDDGADHFIAPLNAIDKVELELGIIQHRFHRRGSPLHPMMVC